MQNSRRLQHILQHLLSEEAHLVNHLPHQNGSCPISCRLCHRIHRCPEGCSRINHRGAGKSPELQADYILLFLNILVSVRSIQIFFKVSRKITQNPLDIWWHWCHHRSMKEKHRWPTKTIRANPEVFHQARVAAVTQKKMLGQWLEEAIVEKIQREQKLSEEAQ